MSAIRVLHVEDEPDIRDVVGISLSMDPNLVLQQCDSGTEALVIAEQWEPDIILLDVTMPTMDGPETLARLRDNPATARIPVVFMTARAQPRELARFRNLGAVDVIPKPFDPMTLASNIRAHIRPPAVQLDKLRAGFLNRLLGDVCELDALRDAMSQGFDRASKLATIQMLSHRLAGAGGIFGFSEISEAAAALEDLIITEQSRPDNNQAVGDALDRLIAHGRAEVRSAARAPT
jgi:two-component system OmpR family response regulator